ncbi:very long chain fatty acid elongase AAEL008004-like isoform X1 [Zophobas morio]|uniref:very long chain fatty acid elongase AAEL008004-like isoform X1 n=2 Tax=Zophobas morio TaxID=2755281 RepID=UPI003083D75C
MINGFLEMIDNQGDPRVKNWLVLKSPFPTLCVCLMYLYFVKTAGPQFMKTRKPLSLKKVLIFYNIFQVTFNAYLVYEMSVSGWLNHYNYRCQPLVFSKDPLELRMINAAWWYLIIKHIDLADTIFFVLRKKNNQITNLHLIHHCIMPFSVWFGVKLAPSGHGTFFGYINCFVHVIMYFYYVIAALGPRFQKYLWWKKYLTTVQMIQFVLITVHSCQLFFIDCDYPRSFLLIVIIHAILILGLFWNFYRTTYQKTTTKNEETKTQNRGTSKLQYCFIIENKSTEDSRDGMSEENKLKKGR